MILAEAAAGRANNLDLIRALAAGGVILSHCCPLTGAKWEPGHWLTGAHSLGSLSVFAFFTLSGFLISRSWCEDPHPLRYVARRSARIFPALAAAVVLAALVMGPLVTTLSASEYFRSPAVKSYVLHNIGLFQIHYSLPGVFTNNPLPHGVNGSLWTLPVEAYLYVIVPAAWLIGRYLLPVRWRTAALLGLLIAGLAWDWHKFRHGAVTEVYYSLIFPSTLFAALFFGAGALAYRLRDRIELRGDLALAAAGLQYAVFYTQHVFLVTLLTLPYLVLWFGFLPVKALAGFRKHGDPSYGLYVYAFPIQQLCVWAVPGIGPWSLFALCLPPIIAISYLSWHYLERPVLHLVRDRLKPRSESKSPPVIPFSRAA